MASGLDILKNIYDLVRNDRLRAILLRAGESLGIRKDILRLDTNDLCNLACIMCGTHTVRGTGNHFMSLGDFRRVIDLFSPTTRFAYLGCAFEPLVTPGFADYAIYAKSAGIPFVSFPTNGLLLKEDMSKVLVDNKIDEVIISMNGYDRTDYNRIMCRSDYDRLVENLDYLCDYKKRKSSALPRIRINTILMKSNVRKLDCLLDMIKKWDVSAVQFRELIVDNSVNDIEQVKNEMVSGLASDELEDVARKLKKAAVRLAGEGKQIILPESLAARDRLASQKSVNRKKRCVIPYFSIWVEHNGKVKSCIYDKKGALGNVFTDSPDEIRKAQIAFRRISLRGKCDQSGCTMNADSSVIL